MRHTFFRSYGVILPSSLTRDHSSALGFSPHLPVSVCGTITEETHYEAFLGSMGSASLRDKSLLITSRSLIRFWICLESPPTCLNRDIQHPDGLPFCVPPSLITRLQWYRNINLFPITYACRPRLRDRLTLRRLTLLRKP